MCQAACSLVPSTMHIVFSLLLYQLHSCFVLKQVSLHVWCCKLIWKSLAYELSIFFPLVSYLASNLTSSLQFPISVETSRGDLLCWIIKTLYPVPSWLRTFNVCHGNFWSASWDADAHANATSPSSAWAPFYSADAHANATSPSSAWAPFYSAAICFKFWNWLVRNWCMHSWTCSICRSRCELLVTPIC